MLTHKNTFKRSQSYFEKKTSQTIILKIQNICINDETKEKKINKNGLKIIRNTFFKLHTPHTCCTRTVQ